MDKRMLTHGGDLYGAARLCRRAEEEILDFSANINPLGMQPQVRKAVLDGMDAVECYPDPLCRRLVEALAKWEQVPEDWILCGNGGADLIYRFAYGLRPGKALLPAPAFAEYEEALLQAGTEVVLRPLNKDKQVDEEFVMGLPADMGAVFLCNPNNPTGLLVERELILGLLKKARTQNTLVFLDECFLDFTREPDAYTLKEYLGEFPNLIILKSFTKMFAIPGLRLGYALCADQGILERMRLAGQPWPVGGLAQEAGITALADREFPVHTRKFVEKERAFLKEQMESLKLFVYDGAANFLCFRAAGEKNLYEKMLDQEILIRRCANYRNLDDEHYRVAVRGRKENMRLLDGLRFALWGG